jgi:amidase
MLSKRLPNPSLHATCYSGLRPASRCVLVTLNLVLAALVAACAGGSRDTAPVAPFALEELTIRELQDAMASGRYTSQQLVELYLRRIIEIDRGGPALRSISDINPDALRIAGELDAERRQGRVRGPLHGVPLVIKDNLDTADQMPTTAGSLALEGSTAPRDAFVVERLRAAGAVILGKASLSEWANFRSARSSSGWSARAGQVKNPYALDRNPCGSSSGSGVAVAANLAAVAVGTETDGSVTCPASVNGIVGIKPTIGLVSRAGIIPIAHSQDTAGPMARTVTDAAILLTAMSGRDPRDAATDRPGNRAPDYAAGLDAGGLKGARIGVSRAVHFGYSAPADRLAEAAIEVLRAQGAVIVDPVEIPNLARLDACEMVVLQYEFKADLNAYLAGRPGARVRTLADLIAFNVRERAREMPFFGQDLFEAAEKKGPLTTPEYLTSLADCQRWAGPEGIDAAMAKDRLDALMAPTMGPAWPTDHLNGDHVLGASTTAAAVAGYPHVTVPAGQVSGLPVGLSFFGRAWSEATLIRLAYAFEQATHHRRVPRLLPTVE